VQFAYDGSLFESFARQPGRRTVEGELLDALVRADVISSAKVARYGVASRTDAGVSAWENVFAIDTAADPRALPHIQLPAGLWFWAARAVAPSFSPRRAAAKRVYSYSLPHAPDRNLEAMQDAAQAFVGVHDFSNFCRREVDVRTRRRIDTVTVSRTARADVVEVAAPNFLWEQVRRLVHALLQVGDGIRSPASIVPQLAGRGKPEPPAPPEPLVLKRVDVGLPFGAPSRSSLRRVDRMARKAWAVAGFYEGLASRRPTARR
jgi:tRNA pseudouridine38-40 synthase